MKVTIEGDANRYYVQTLCMIFFPGAKFSENEEITEETPEVVVHTSREGGAVTATVTISIGSLSSSYTHTASREEGRRIDEGKIAVGIALFKAGEKLFGYTPSWGILTGVRPTKLAKELYAAGISNEEIRHILCEEYIVNPKKAAIAADIAENEARIINALPPRSCSVYISIPFCPSRCAYCSFVSYSTKRLLSMIPDYLIRLCEDIDRMFRVIRELDMKVVTIYIGGGTPTILEADQLSMLLECINRNLDRSYLMEFTLEGGRPDTITAEKLKAAADGGITRVSINPQTLDDHILEAIGRRHTADDFFRAYAIARESGIKYINTDLIAGLPGEKFAGFAHSVDTVLAMRPDNVTFHTFCVKKAADILKSGTEVYSRTGGDTGKSVDYSQLRARLAGYIPYYLYRQKNTVGNFENVGYALPGAEGLYNIFIMEEIHSIFSAGAGGVTKLIPADAPAYGPKKIERRFMPKYPYEYLAMDRATQIEPFFDELLRVMHET